MKYPKINRQASREVNVPSLAGGLNLRDSLTGIRDNQMTECVNMWFKDGKLRTRPSFDTTEDMKVAIDRNTEEFFGEIKVHSNISTDKGTLVSVSRCIGTKLDGASWEFLINFWWQDKDSFCDAGSFSIGIPEFEWGASDGETNPDKSSNYNGEQYSVSIKWGSIIADKKKEYPSSTGSVTGNNNIFENDWWYEYDLILKRMRDCSYFLAFKDGVVYCYASNGEEFYIYKLDCNKEEPMWEQVKDDGIYAPTVYAHCQRTGWDDFEGTQFEGYNLIGNSYKMIYSAYNEADSDKSHPMRYKLGQELPDKGIIKVEITTCVKGENETDERKTEVKTTEHKIEYDSTDYENFTAGKIVIEKFGAGNTSPDGLRLFIKYNYVGFVIASQDDGNEDKVFVVATLDTNEKKQRYACNEDNIVITAPLKADANNMKKVFGMTQSIWFGGSANGINDGSRLFLCGNTEEKERSLVVWSSLNNPLYFSENNYAYVGDKSQAVTAFGQQGESLVIFKENSTYYSYYVANNNINADDLINQTVVDYEANSVYFPMIQLNGSIGCDCPNTVQLCRNRLVWANSDGNVYAIYSNNQYSERTIYKLSDMIHPALAKENDLKNAVSCDFEGHYLLGVNNKIYVMDYNSYGYQYAASFSKTEDSNIQIPWYVWEFDFCLNFYVFSKQDTLAIGQYINTDTGGVIAFCVLDGEKTDGRDEFLIYNEDTNECDIAEKPIKSKCTTKFFDFLSSGYLKNIDRASVGFGNNGGKPIQLNFITDVGNVSETVMLCSPDTNERGSDFVTVKQFYPTLKSVRTFGINFECEGPLLLEGISLQYKMLGGVK